MSQDAKKQYEDMSRGAKSTLGAAKSGVNAAKKAKSAASSARRKSRGTVKAARAMGGKKGKAITKLIPLKVKLIIAGVLGLLLIVVLVFSLISNSQTRRLSFFTPNHRDGIVEKKSRRTGNAYISYTYDGPEWSDRKELDSLLYKREEIVNDSRELLMVVAEARAKNLQKTQSDALEDARVLARRNGVTIDLDYTAASVQFELATDLEIVGSGEVDLVRVGKTESQIPGMNISGNTELSGEVSPNVLRYKDRVQAECNKNGISDYSDIVLAIMMQESGGRDDIQDVFQCSESLGLAPNSIGLETSLLQGPKYFAETLRLAETKGCDLETAIQAYNYGGAFIDYVAKRGGVYTKELAEAFANEMGGSYGDPSYVEHVSRYINGSLPGISVNSIISKRDYQLLAAYSIMLGNGQTVKIGDSLYTPEGITLKRNWSFLALFNGTFGQIDYIKTLKEAIKHLVEGTFFEKGEGFYTHAFAENSDGGLFFEGYREVTEWHWYTEEELAEKEKEGGSGTSGPPRPENPTPTIDYAIGSPGEVLDEEEDYEPGVNGEWVTTIETFYYMKPIIIERPLADVVKTMFKVNVDDYYVGTMRDTDGDGYAEVETGTGTIREAIYTLAEQTFALLTDDGKDVGSTMTGGVIGCPLKHGQYVITYGFGLRDKPCEGATTDHKGVDIALPVGTELVAAIDGVVTAAGWECGWKGGGYTVIIEGNNGYTVFYHHMSSITVAQGQQVKRGQLIGYSGNTGTSSGPHLHFGVQFNGVFVDPLPLMGHAPNATTLNVKEILINKGSTFTHPLSGEFTFTQDFSTGHSGIDIACPEGTSIYAAEDGVVVMAGKASDFGLKLKDGTPDDAWCVKIEHADGTYSLYWHLRENGNFVAPGERVVKGQKIGESGNTGDSTGPHLHFEVRAGNTPVDPKPYLGVDGVVGKEINF